MPPDIQPIPGFADPISSLTHLAGALWFALAALPLLWHSRRGTRAGLALYGVAVVFALAMSGTYHLLDPGTGHLTALLGGALAYTVGGLCDGLRWPTPWPGVVGPHEVFHLCVLAGVALHWRHISAISRAASQPVP